MQPTFTCLKVRKDGAIVVPERLDDATNASQVKEGFEKYLVNPNKNGDHHDENGTKH